MIFLDYYADQTLVKLCIEKNKERFFPLNLPNIEFEWEPESF